MYPLHQHSTGGSRTDQPNHRHVDEWETWEEDDEEQVTPIDPEEQVAHPSTTPASTRPSKPPNNKASRYPSVKVRRLKSRQRQKAQNAKAGIKLITDMTAFRPKGAVAQQSYAVEEQPVKFVDAAALKALEGEPSSASVGNWNWLRRNRNQSPASASTPKSASTRTPDQAISPEDRPIVIGIALPSEEAAERDASPGTALSAISQGQAELHRIPKTRVEQIKQSNGSSPLARNHQRSVWSPDTPDTVSSFNSARPTSSVYSQVTSAPSIPAGDNVPPVPALPSTYKKTPQQKLLSLELGSLSDDDGGTPCTLFEEDGIPSPERQAKGNGSALTPNSALTANSCMTPDSANSRSHGWWDHVVTPFTDKRFTFASRKQQNESANHASGGDSWAAQVPVGNQARDMVSSSPPPPLPMAMTAFSQAPIVRAPAPRKAAIPQTSPSEASSSRSSPALETDFIQDEKPRIIVTSETPYDQPPPYSPPKKLPPLPIRYRAVFPPDHPLHAQFPPSPHPGSPGLGSTMSSQGPIQMSEIPITPTAASYDPPSHAPLPTRPIGTRLPQEHAHATRGDIDGIERQRRRHEKEDVAVRRLGNLWRGRGCIPKSGCFGRTGREGRKKRRIWMAIWGAIVSLLILIIILSVVLTRPHHTHIDSIWVNLTDFPPMPTGVLTFVGPDNTVSRSSCTAPETLWSCSLPKEEHQIISPYQADQPTVFFQIQYDNGTAKAWDVPNGDPPTAIPKRSHRAASRAKKLARKRDNIDGFEPDPTPPSFDEQWFLGETTDDIKSDQKAGEATPFFVSLLKSENDTVGFPSLSKRDGDTVGNISVPDVLPDPDLNSDGTPAPAVLIPRPVYQPVRLYDRGMETEHYGFYTHYERTIFLKSVNATDDSTEGGESDQEDLDGGCQKTSANFLVTWAETRMLVQIWTKTLDDQSSKLLEPDYDPPAKAKNDILVRPGTMPYPVTITVDTHGGDPDKKLVWEWPMDDEQHLDMDNAKLLANSMGNDGTWINPRGTGDAKYGGFDGGTGGCKCQWVNWV